MGCLSKGTAANNVIQGNYIGITRSGARWGIADFGVLIQEAPDDTVGGVNQG